MSPAAIRPARARASFVVLLSVAVLAGCSGSPLDANPELDGCIAGDRGTIALGVTNSAGDPLEITGIEIADGEGVEVIDRFIAPDEDARSTAVRFDDGGRDALNGVDLDRESIEPDAAAFVGIEVARTGAAEGRVNGVTITTAERSTTAPVTLVLRDDCG